VLRRRSSYSVQLLVFIGTALVVFLLVRTGIVSL
jgi:hypothetical protein